MRRFFAAAGILAALGAVAPAMAQDSTGLSARLEAILDDFRARYGFPGATAAIILPDGTLATAATGLADVETGRAMTPDTPMLAASIGKSFVAVTALALEADGVLARDHLLSAYLGNLDWFSRLPNQGAISIGDLLRHTSGLPDHVHMAPFPAEMARRVTAGADALSPEGAIAFVLDAEPLFPPGAGWSYSDTGYLLLGLTIERATGRSYYDLVKALLLDPLGLDATAPSDRREITGLAVGYTVPDNPFGIPARTMDGSGRLLWDPAMEWTGGGLVSTSPDLARWGHLLFAGEATTAPYLHWLLDGVAVSLDTPSIRYGAGIAIYDETSRGPVWGHGGWIPGYVSSLRHYAAHGVTVAFQVNTDVGIVDDSIDLVPALEAALADLAIAYVGGAELTIFPSGGDIWLGYDTDVVAAISDFRGQPWGRPRPLRKRRYHGLHPGCPEEVRRS